MPTAKEIDYLNIQCTYCRLLIHISWMALNYRKKYIARLALPTARWLLSTPPHPQPGERPPIDHWSNPVGPVRHKHPIQ